MDNPLLERRPDNFVHQISAYARDLAYLTICGDLPVTFPAWPDTRPPKPPNAQDLSDNVKLFVSKWKGGPDGVFPHPTAHIENFGYVKFVGNQVDFQLTREAFLLLELPITRPTVFISYRRSESSAFALLVEARLRLKGVDSIFIDKDIKAGEDWHEEIAGKIEECNYFAWLVGKTTLESAPIMKEVEIALNSKRRILAIWHNGYSGADYPDTVQSKNAIIVQNESARDYETAINELLNSMDIPTY